MVSGRPMFTSICIGEKGSLSNWTARHRARLVAKIIINFSPSTAITFEMAGFDADERELWDIPEARRYILVFSSELQQRGINLERLLPQTLNMIRACEEAALGRPVVVIGDQQDAVRTGVDEVIAHYEKTKHTVN